MSLELVFAITAVTFTILGWWFGAGSANKVVIEHTIDTLIEAGYIKTRKNKDGQVELVKHNEK